MTGPPTGTMPVSGGETGIETQSPPSVFVMASVPLQGTDECSWRPS